MIIHKEREINQIKIGAIISYCTILFNIISGLIYTPWMVKQIGQSDYGLYTLSISLMGMFAMDFGIGSSVSRFISKYRALGDERKISEFLGIIYKLYLLIASIIAIILIIFFTYINEIYTQLTPIEIEKLKVIYCISGLFTVISFQFTPLNGIIISYEKFIFQKSLDLVQKILVVILMIIALNKGYGLYSLVLVNTIIGILMIIIKLRYVKTQIYHNIDIRCNDKSILREILKFSIWTTIIMVAQRFIINITPSILGAFSGTGQISIFSVAMTIEGYVYTFSTALSGMFLPKVTNMIYKNNSRNLDEIEKLMIRVGRIQLFIVGCIISIFASVGSEFIAFWMGDSFKESYIVATLLIITSLVTVTQEIGNTMLIATNKIKYDAISVGVVASISFSLSMFLSKYLGAIGAGISIFIGNFIGRIIVKNYIYIKVLGLNIRKFFKECHLSMAIPIMITFFIGRYSLYRFKATSMTMFIIKVLILIFIYSSLMWIISVNRLEKDEIINSIKKKNI